ncbi:MAG: Type 1 glutamine amidotransferase-like domain-containing protein, partial [Lachnospiraceae bacterium]|nr:Type 1 glutamine amidotransferase-like domain-containing protein [Lachnospiraceae bacterium]
MTLFLTSSFTDREQVGIDPTAGFLEELKKRLPRRLIGVFVCSAPDTFDITDLYGASTADCFKREGFFFEKLTILDARNDSEAARILEEADLIILSGGHVPTQNRYFEKIGLREIMQKLAKKEAGPVIIGISAGTMNCADTVYAQPEEEGDALDP